MLLEPSEACSFRAGQRGSHTPHPPEKHFEIDSLSRWEIHCQPPVRMRCGGLIWSGLLATCALHLPSMASARCLPRSLSEEQSAIELYTSHFAAERSLSCWATDSWCGAAKAPLSNSSQQDSGRIPALPAILQQLDAPATGSSVPPPHPPLLPLTAQDITGITFTALALLLAASTGLGGGFGTV